MKGKSASPTPSQQFLSFSLNPSLQGLLAANQLAEIIRLDPSQIISISEMPSAVIGVCPWQGEVLWLVDLAYLFGFDPLMKPANTQANCSIIKVRTHRGNLGLWVEKVGKLISCKSSSLQSPELSYAQLQRRANFPTQKESIASIQPHWIQASWEHSKGSILPILNVEGILQDLVQE
ncbi:MAG: chemotaxis protein CheW [Cyanobacteriota bacterium]|nr:chemotaxis protein CheW [Cyanobacteriota bacterium]